MLIISTHRNSVIRTEDLSAIYRLKNNKTGKFTKIIALQFKSGNETRVECRTLKETKEFFDIITKMMEKDYNTLIK